MALLPILVAGCNPDQLRGLLNVALASPGAAGTPTAGPTQTPGASVPADNSGPGASSKPFNPPKWAIGKWKDSRSGTVAWTLSKDDITGDDLDFGALKRVGAVSEVRSGSSYRLVLRASAKGAGSYHFAKGFTTSYLLASGFVKQQSESGEAAAAPVALLTREGSPPPDADKDDDTTGSTSDSNHCFGCATPTPCYSCAVKATGAPITDTPVAAPEPDSGHEVGEIDFEDDPPIEGEEDPDEAFKKFLELNDKSRVTVKLPSDFQFLADDVIGLGFKPGLPSPPPGAPQLRPILLPDFAVVGLDGGVKFDVQALGPKEQPRDDLKARIWILGYKTGDGKVKVVAFKITKTLERAPEKIDPDNPPAAQTVESSEVTIEPGYPKEYANEDEAAKGEGLDEAIPPQPPPPQG